MSIQSIDTKTKLSLLANTNIQTVISYFYLVTFFTNNYKSAMQMPHCGGKLRQIGNRVQMLKETIDIMPCSHPINKFNPLVCCKDYYNYGKNPPALPI